MQTRLNGAPRVRPRVAVLAAVAVIVAAMPAVGLAQSRVGVTVNAGTQATSTAFTTRSTLTLHREDGALRADYGVDAGAFIDLGPAARTRSPRATAPKRTIRRAYPAPAPERRPPAP